MARRHGLQHVERLAATHLADDESIRPHPQGVAHEFADADFAAAFETRAPRLEPGDVRTVDPQFGRVLDRHDALGGVDARGEGTQERGLAARGAAADDDRQPRTHTRIEQHRVFV